ncbi:MAG: molecular chaperone [Bacteroidetes bacterium]|nr:molecular chaperone [Bacteroidota bacterium]
MFKLKFLLKLPAFSRVIYFISGFILFSVFSSATAIAQGDLMLFPKRVVFEGSKKSYELNLANTGKDTARYNISIINYRMKEDGSFEKITQPGAGENFAIDYLRFFPRSVTLAPNEAQVVKIQLTKTNLMSPGEYRSHVYFRSVPTEKPLGEKESTPNKDSTISVQLIPVFGISIPVIIRVGESTAKVTLSDCSLEIENNIPRLKMIFNRTGNRSVYGDITVNYISPKGKITRVGIVKGLAVYTPNPFRRLQLNLDEVAGIDYRSGKLHIVYTAQADSKSAKLAEAELVLR